MNISILCTLFLCFMGVFLLKNIHAQTPEEQMDTIWLSPHGSENDTTCGATKELACSLSAATNILARWSAERREPNTHLIFTSGEYALTRQFYTGDETRQLIVETHPDEPTPAVVTRADVEDSATISFASTYMTLRRIIFAHSIIHSTGALVHLRASESIAVEDCHFRNNTSYSPPFSAAVSITGTSNTTFINCTWSDNLILGPTPSSREPNPPGGAALSWIHDSYPDQASSKHVYVLFKNCSFINNGIKSQTAPARARGGAVYIGTTNVIPWYSVGQLHVHFDSTRFAHNSVTTAASQRALSASSAPFFRGGALAISTNVSTSVTISNCVFEYNSISLEYLKSHASFGGAVDLDLMQDGSSVIVHDSIFNKNTAHAGFSGYDDASAGLCAGGALNVFSTASVSLIRSNFSENFCHGARGGIFAGYSQGGAVSHKMPPGSPSSDEKSLFRVISSVFSHNGAFGAKSDPSDSEASGGAIVVNRSPLRDIGLEIIQSTFSNNFAQVRCGAAFGGAIHLITPSNSSAPIQPYQIIDSFFLWNKAYSFCLDGTDQASVRGGAVVLEVAPSAEVTLKRSTFNNNGAFSFISSGGALYVWSRFGHLAVGIESSLFEANIVAGEALARGGAIDIHTNFRLQESQLNVSATTFKSNSVECSQSATRIAASMCSGGAVNADVSDTLIRDTILINNTVSCHIVTQEIRECGLSAGGAISSLSPATIQVSGSILRDNRVCEPLGFGGAIYAAGADITNSTFESNGVFGNNYAIGGAIAVENRLGLTNTTILFSVARVTPLSSSQICDNLGYPLPQSSSCGGAAAILSQIDIESSHVTVSGSSADYGASFFATSATDYISKALVSDTHIIDSQAARSGGALFIAQSCSAPSLLHDLCTNVTSGSVINTTAILYGPRCSTSASQLAFIRPVESHVAPGQTIPTQLRLQDIFGQTVVEESAKVVASLLNSTPAHSASLRTGVPQDTTLSQRGIFSFLDFSLLGKFNATVEVLFRATVSGKQAGVNAMCETGAPLHQTVLLRTQSCVPSHFVSPGSLNSTEVVCVLCPANTYLITPTDEPNCIPCPEKPHHGDAHEENNYYSCLNSPEDQDVAQSSAHERLWSIPAGYFPVPSVDDAREILACPNHACLAFDCSLHPSEHSDWTLNCSACPKQHHAHKIASSSSNEAGEDCHCVKGYSDRLCSRCSCTETECYFFSGEPEMRHCTLCKQPSTIAISSAIIGLQVSLVVFLLFKRSAIALLLAEAAIATTLFILGIGETWMLDLVIMLALLFVITSLSQRLPRSHKKKQQSLLDDTEDESTLGDTHDNHKHDHHHSHAVAVKTAGIAKITIFFLQTAASVVKPAAWPKWIGALISQLDALNLRVSGLECFSPTLFGSPVGKLAAQLLMPLAVGLNIIFAAFIAAIILKIGPVTRLRACIAFCKAKCKSSPKSSRSIERSLISDSDDNGLHIEQNKEEHERPLLEQQQQQQQPAAQSWSRSDLISRVQFSCFFLLSASYFELGNVILEVWRPCQKGYMANFPWIPCGFGNQQYSSLFWIAMTGFICFTVGIPAFFGTVMFCNRRRILAGDPKMESRFGFLFESYKAEYFWWDLLWFLRRVLLSVAVSTLAAAPGYQMALILFVLLGTLFIHRSVKPFADRMANMLELLSSACLIFVIAMGSEIQQYSSSDTTLMTPILQNFVWVLVALTTAILVLALVLPALSSIIQAIRHKATSPSREPHHFD